LEEIQRDHPDVVDAINTHPEEFFQLLQGDDEGEEGEGGEE